MKQNQSKSKTRRTVFIIFAIIVIGLAAGATVILLNKRHKEAADRAWERSVTGGKDPSKVVPSLSQSTLPWPKSK